MKYWGTLPLPLDIEVLQHNYGSEGWGVRVPPSARTRQEFHDLAGLLFLSLNGRFRLLGQCRDSNYLLKAKTSARRGRLVDAPIFVTEIEAATTASDMALFISAP